MGANFGVLLVTDDTQLLRVAAFLVFPSTYDEGDVDRTLTGKLRVPCGSLVVSDTVTLPVRKTLPRAKSFLCAKTCELSMNGPFVHSGAFKTVRKCVKPRTLC